MTSPARQLGSKATDGRKNKLINGNFDVWQRGTSGFTLSAQYTSDRWRQDLGNGTTVSTSRQTFQIGQTDVPNNPTYFSRSVVTTGGLSNSTGTMQQRVEGVKNVSNGTYTVSFWVKADAPKNMAFEVLRIYGTGGTPSTVDTAVFVNKFAVTTSWQKVTFTMNLSALTGKTIGTNGNDYFQILFWFDAGSDFNARTDSLGNQSGTFDIAQVQLEAGEVATDFEQRSYGEELALCQRYYETGDFFRTGVLQNSTAGLATEVFRAVKRIPPTVNATGSTFINFTGVSATTTRRENFDHHATGGTSNAQGRYNLTWTADAEL